MRGEASAAKNELAKIIIAPSMKCEAAARHKASVCIAGRISNIANEMAAGSGEGALGGDRREET